MEALQERIQRFTRFGGVDLSRVDPEERPFVMPGIHMGTTEYKKAIFYFRCPECGNVAKNNQDMEPMCTGPSWTDEHPGAIMERMPS